MKHHFTLSVTVLASVAAVGLLITEHQSLAACQVDEQKVAFVVSGGHETDSRDKGRPVVLVAGALGVKPEVFREAFSHVRPAREGYEPDPRQVGDNKQALLAALGKYGITNERLDVVSDRYRYVRGTSQLWPTKAAAGYAVVARGQVVKIVISDGGFGYSSVPRITIPGISDVQVTATVSVSRDFAKNGSISRIEFVSTKTNRQ